MIGADASDTRRTVKDLMELSAWPERGDIRERVERFAGGSLSRGVRGNRERSYDHCYNYFRESDLSNRDLESSCAVLGFYLASWGMYRGSSYLFRETNSRHLAPVVEYAAEHRDVLSAIDVDRYSDENRAVIADAYSHLAKMLLPQGGVATTLVTKVMVGVFGCTPAYDTYFRLGIRSVANNSSREAFWRVTDGSLELLSTFYDANNKAIDELQAESLSWRFMDDVAAGACYTKAKIIDMYFFNLGYSPDGDERKSQRPPADI